MRVSLCHPLKKGWSLTISCERFRLLSEQAADLCQLLGLDGKPPRKQLVRLNTGRGVQILIRVFLGRARDLASLHQDQAGNAPGTQWQQCSYISPSTSRNTSELRAARSHTQKLPAHKRLTHNTTRPHTHSHTIYRSNAS